MRLPKGSHRITRVIALCMLLMWGIFYLLIWAAVIQSQVAMEAVGLLLLLGALWGLLCYAALTDIPRVDLSEKGIRVRVLLYSRSYTWKEIRQAGILYRRGRNCWYNQLVLLPPGGSPRKYKDKLFVLRNYFVLIKLPLYTEEIRSYVCCHYGPLDFDLSDGKSEQSIVIEQEMDFELTE